MKRVRCADRRETHTVQQTHPGRHMPGRRGTPPTTQAAGLLAPPTPAGAANRQGRAQAAAGEGVPRAEPGHACFETLLCTCTPRRVSMAHSLRCRLTECFPRTICNPRPQCSYYTTYPDSPDVEQVSFIGHCTPEPGVQACGDASRAATRGAPSADPVPGIGRAAVLQGKQPLPQLSTPPASYDVHSQYLDSTIQTVARPTSVPVQKMGGHKPIKMSMRHVSNHPRNICSAGHRRTAQQIRCMAACRQLAWTR